MDGCFVHTLTEIAKFELPMARTWQKGTLLGPLLCPSPASDPQVEPTQIPATPIGERVV